MFAATTTGGIIFTGATGVMAESEHGFGFPVDASVHIEAVRGGKRERPTAPDAAGAD